MRGGELTGRQQQCRTAVADLGAVAGSDGAVGLEDSLEGPEGVERAVWPNALIAGDTGDGNDLSGVRTGVPGGLRRS